MLPLLLLACVGLSGTTDAPSCLNDPEDSTALPTTDTAEIAVTGAPDADTWVSANLTLTGFAVADVAIEWIDVLGVRATGTANYAQWSVPLPLDTLQAAADDDQRVAIDVLAKLSCAESAASFGGPELRVLPDTGIPVEGLAVDLSDPEGCYLPQGDAVGVEVLVTAEAGSVGGTVTLTRSGGSLDDSDGVLTLVATAGDTAGTVDGAAARTWLRPGTSSRWVAVVATAYPSPAESDSVWVAGPPVFSPTALTLGAGRTATASVSTDGTLLECRLVGDTAALASVTIAGELVDPVVTYPPFEGDCGSFTPDAKRTIEVVVAEGITATSATLACTDRHGQTKELMMTLGG